MTGVVRIDEVLQNLGASMAGDADEFMVGRLLLCGPVAHFIVGWKGERPTRREAGLIDKIELGKFAGGVAPRTAGSPLFEQVVDLDPEEQVRRVRGSFSMSRSEGARFKLRWLSPVLVARLTTGATLSFTLPSAEARRRVKAWLAQVE